MKCTYYSLGTLNNFHIERADLIRCFCTLQTPCHSYTMIILILAIKRKCEVIRKSDYQNETHIAQIPSIHFLEQRWVVHQPIAGIDIII